MAKSARIAPPNSLLVISDRKGGVPPQVTRGTSIWFTSSCIVIGCLAFVDGKTQVTLGAARDVDPGIRPAFDGLVETPSHAVTVSTVEREKVLECAVKTIQTRVRIWVNRPTEPDDVIVGLN